MPIFKSCAVVLTGNKEVYRKGEQVTGVLVIDVNEDVVVKGVRVYLYGESLTKWSEFSPGSLGGTEDYVSKEKYFGLVITLFGKKQNATGPNHTFTAGRHKYNFKFNLPNDGLPSSYEGEYGAIRYWVKVEVDRPFPKLNQCWYRGITVLNDINVNDAKFKNPVRRQAKKQVSKALGIGDAGTLTLTASIDRGAYCAGEKIAVSAVVSNETTKDMGKLKAQIVQKVVFTAKGENKTRELVLRVLEGASPIAKGEERVWKDQLMEVDPVPPSTTPRSCHIINITYYVKVLVEVPLGFNLETTMPITIGTIPYGHSASAPRGASASSALEIDASSSITYTKCSRGFQTCRKSDGNFVNYSYTPMCAYVPNYVFPPPPRPTPARAQTTRAAAAPQRTAAAAAPQRTAAAAAKPKTTPPPTTGKAPLPAATVHAPTPARAPNQAPTVGAPPCTPTAPPMELPPSYESVLAMNYPSAIRETAVIQEKAEKPYGVLVSRFPDSHIQEFRDTIEKEGPSLAAFEGDIIACAPQPLHQPEAWPSRTSVAMFMFPSVEVATEWFTKTPRIADTKWLGSCDAFVGTMFEQYREINTIFSMTKIRMRKGIPKAKIAKFSTLYTKHIRPLRLMKTGVSLLNGKQHKMLRGRWLDEGVSFSLSQWEGVEKLYEYKIEKNGGIYKEANDLMKEIYEIKPGVLFQTEDLSPFHVSFIQPVERTESPAVEMLAEKTETGVSLPSHCSSESVTDDENETDAAVSIETPDNHQEDDTCQHDVDEQATESLGHNEATGGENEAGEGINEATGGNYEATGIENEATVDQNQVQEVEDLSDHNEAVGCENEAQDDEGGVKEQNPDQTERKQKENKKSKSDRQKEAVAC